MGACCSSDLRERRGRPRTHQEKPKKTKPSRPRRKNKIKQSPVKIIVTPPTPEKKFRSSETDISEENATKQDSKEKKTSKAMDDGAPTSSNSDFNPAMDRFRALRGQEVSGMRRASHAGFDSHRMVNLARRQSLPAHLLVPDDSQRKLHNSSACVNLIQEFHSMKVVSKDGSEHYMDEKLQNILRQLKKTPSTQVQQQDTHVDDELFTPDDNEVKRSSSQENVKKFDDKAEGRDKMRRTSSDTKVGAVDIADPEGSDEEE
ncbi:uncharacterized protein LOC120339192 [Styela clava]